jgi:hypothetical protein
MEILNYGKCENGINYYPEFNDNRELSEDKKFYVVVKPMTGSLLKRFKKMEKMELVGKKNKQELKSNAAEVQAAVWDECVVRIVNLTLVDPNTGEKSDSLTGQALYDAIPPELSEEILKAVESSSVLEEGLKKL